MESRRKAADAKRDDQGHADDEAEISARTMTSEVTEQEFGDNAQHYQEESADENHLHSALGQIPLGTVLF
jgi:hypothetical protein